MSGFVIGDALNDHCFGETLLCSSAIAGTCLLLVVPNLTRGGRSFALIENVVTDQALRRRGVGTALLRAAFDRAWAGDCYKIMLASGRADEGVLRFYETAGFTRGGKTFFQARRD